MFNDYTDWRSSRRDQIPTIVLCGGKRDCVQRGNQGVWTAGFWGPLQHSQIAKPFATPIWLKWEFHRFTIMEWKGAPYFRTKPDGYKISKCDKHVWNLDSYLVRGLIWAYPAVLISGEKLGFSHGWLRHLQVLTSKHKRSLSKAPEPFYVDRDGPNGAWSPTRGLAATAQMGYCQQNLHDEHLRDGRMIPPQRLRQRRSSKKSKGSTKTWPNRCGRHLGCNLGRFLEVY